MPPSRISPQRMLRDLAGPMSTMLSSQWSVQSRFTVRLAAQIPEAHLGPAEAETGTPLPPCRLSSGLHHTSTLAFPFSWMSAMATGRVKQPVRCHSPFWCFPSTQGKVTHCHCQICIRWDERMPSCFHPGLTIACLQHAFCPPRSLDYLQQIRTWIWE